MCVALEPESRLGYVRYFRFRTELEEHMTRLLLSVVTAFILAAGSASSVLAQDKGKAAKGEKGKPVMKVLAESDKTQAFEVRSKPGDQNTSVPTSNLRVVRALKGGTLLRTYADGKTEKVVWKTGEARIIPPTGAIHDQERGEGRDRALRRGAQIRNVVRS